MKEIKLPSEDFLGQLIGKDGENIKLLETLTGVSVKMGNSPLSVFAESEIEANTDRANALLQKLVERGKVSKDIIKELSQSL